MDLFRYFTSPLSTRRRTQKPGFADQGCSPTANNQDDDVGCEWVEVDEPGGIFKLHMKRRRQLLQLDQVRHVIHYDNFRKFMRVQDIALITAVEEIDDDGFFQWWMSIQDTSSAQVWIVHFSSFHRLQVWIELLRSVTAATGSRTLITDVVPSSPSCAARIRVLTRPWTAETVLEMNPDDEH